MTLSHSTVIITAMNTENRFSLDEVCDLTGFNKRTVRFYIQEELVDRPEGAGRGAWYGRNHLVQLAEIRKWQGAGLTLDRIRELLKGQRVDELPPPQRQAGDIEIWSHILLKNGLELRVEPGKAGLSPEQIREFTRRLLTTLKDIEDSRE